MTRHLIAGATVATAATIAGLALGAALDAWARAGAVLAAADSHAHQETAGALLALTLLALYPATAVIQSYFLPARRRAS